MNRKYFNYLVKNRKIVLIFLFAIYLAMCFTPGINIQGTPNIERLYEVTVIGYSISVGLTFALPVILFAYVHSKRSVDLYFALPVKRSEQLITNIAFAFLICFGYFIIATLIGVLVFRAIDVRIIKLVVLACFSFITLLIIHSFIFLVANNLFDGVVMIGSYSFFTVLLYTCYSTFFSEVVAGKNYIEFNQTLCPYVSPLYMNVSNFLHAYRFYIPNSTVNVTYLIVVLIQTLACAYGLKKHFIDRNVERAEQLSDDILAYPLVIHSYLVVCLLMIGVSFAASRGHRGEFIFLYCFLLFVYIVATFIYKRKIQLKPIYLAIYGIVLALGIGLGKVAWDTKGFNNAYSYRIDKDKYIQYYYYANPRKSNLAENIVDHGVDAVNLEVTFMCPVDELDKYKDGYECFENIRREAIEYFYVKSDDHPYLGGLHVSNLNSKINDRLQRSSNSYYYQVGRLLTEKELLELEKLDGVEVKIYDYVNDKEYDSVKELIEERENK